MLPVGCWSYEKPPSRSGYAIHSQIPSFRAYSASALPASLLRGDVLPSRKQPWADLFLVTAVAWLCRSWRALAPITGLLGDSLPPMLLYVLIGSSPSYRRAESPPPS